jgi:hypothetical protein
MTSGSETLKRILVGEQVRCPVCGERMRTVPSNWAPGQPLSGAECPVDQRHFWIHADDASTTKEMRARMKARRDQVQLSDRRIEATSSTGKACRPHSLVLGRRYSARASFQGRPGSDFIEGHSYELVDVTYSRYDGCTVFTFRGDDHAPIQWWWPDDESDTLCMVRFRGVE